VAFVADSIRHSRDNEKNQSRKCTVHFSSFGFEVPLTLHGGSGTDAKDFQQAIKAGITMIHINTELRVAWRTGLAEALKRNPDAVAPYKLLPDVVRGVKTVERGRLELFGGISGAAER
jgi:fructose/tagatose bisphosphate aldolase